MILRYFVEESVLVPFLFESAVFVQLSELNYIKSVSDHIGSKQRDVASISVMRFVKLQSVSDQIGSKQRAVASISVMRFVKLQSVSDHIGSKQRAVASIRFVRFIAFIFLNVFRLYFTIRVRSHRI